MTHHTHILLPIVTSEDGTRCSPDCRFIDIGWNTCRGADADLVLDVKRGDGSFVRLDACIAAERAAQDERDATIARLREREARVRALCEGETTYESIAPDVLAILDDDEKDGEG